MRCTEKVAHNYPVNLVEELKYEIDGRVPPALYSSGAAQMWLKHWRENLICPAGL
jgi:hypothetical protein